MATSVRLPGPRTASISTAVAQYGWSILRHRPRPTVSGRIQSAAPDTGPLRSAGSAMALRGGVSGSDGAIVGANRPEFADQVDRLNLADGTWATWFRAPADRWVRILGVDADGHPLLGLEEPPAIVGKIAYPHEPDELLLLLTGPGQTMTIAGAAAGLRPRAANTDSHGSWITASGSLWLYRNGTVSRVANVPDGLYPALRRPSFPPDVPHGQVGADLVFSGPCT